MTKKNLLPLLRRGNFTIIYWDSDEPTLYKGHWDKDVEYDKDEYETMNKSEIKLDYFDAGYLPHIVALLTEALKGKADSI